jgi:succinyl-diaminopimelate desuccinylase
MLTDLERRVIERINDERVVKWVQDLVRIPSVPRPGLQEVETEAARWVEARCHEMELETHWECAAPGRPNVIAILSGAAHARTLMFEGHTDVVTEGDRALWKHDPFGAAIEDRRIYGRGANDMKGGLGAALGALAALCESGVKLKGDILLGALADEEGLMLGVKHFVARGWSKRVTAAIICEPEANRLCISQKGVMWINARTQGKMAHGAMPYAGINPISHMATFIRQVQVLEATEQARRGRDEFLGVPSFSPTRIHAPLQGEAETNNVIPSACQVTFDIRLIPGQTPEEIEAQLREIAMHLRKTDERFSAEFTVLDARPPTATSRDEPLVKTMDAAYRDLFNRAPTYGGVPGSTDGTILHQRAGIPIVTCGPGDTRIPHQVDEYLDIDQLLDATKIYALTALRFLGSADKSED